MPTSRPNALLPIDFVPTELVLPHEGFDQKRVDRVKKSILEDQILKNPPLVSAFNGKYIVLDGATRTTALKQIGCPHSCVQVVDMDKKGDLYSWRHVISSEETFAELLAMLRKLEGTMFELINNEQWVDIFDNPRALCTLLDGAGNTFAISATDENRMIERLEQVVSAYTDWGHVERMIIGNVADLRQQFDQLIAVVNFPTFNHKDVFQTAVDGQLLPAGVTRFVVPERVLNLNIPLEKMTSDTPLESKRDWLANLLAQKINSGAARYYQEPIILID